MTNKKRGPVPKPKGIAEAEVIRANECSSIGGLVLSGTVEVYIKANAHATRDDFRKASKKAIDKYFKELK